MHLILPLARPFAGCHRPSGLRLLSILAAFFACVAGPACANPLEEIPNCTLVPTEWADGDSFLVRTPEQKEFTLRLYGADSIECHITQKSDENRLREQRRYFGITEARPDFRASIELATGYGKKATAEVRSVLAKPFTVHTAFADARGDGRYQRVYGFVITADGSDLAAHLVSKGLARAHGVSRQTYDGRSQDEYRRHLADLELRAARNGAGVWEETDWDKLPEERQTQRREEQEIKLALDRQPIPEGSTLDPNTAARDDLMKLPGIGEEFANRIIEHRPYAKPEDLLNVPGIGPVTFAKIRPYLELPDR